MDVTNEQKVILSGSFKVEISYEVFMKMAVFLKDNNINIVVTDVEKEITNQRENDRKIGELLNLYINRRNLKKWTRISYITAFKNILKNISSDSESWKDVSVGQINREVIEKFNVTNSSEYQYLNIVNSVFSWLVREEIVNYNPCTKHLHKFKKFSQGVRAALKCEKWIDDIEAKKILTEFFKKVKGLIDISMYRFLVLHFILGTRISETFNYIDAVRKIDYDENDVLTTVYIKTKCTKNGAEADFRMPVPDFIHKMIDTDKVLYSKKSHQTVISILRRFIAKNFKDEFCFHGTRAIFRTTIDFIDKDKAFGKDEKEAYINHKTDSYVQNRYHRNDHLIPRIEIMCKYASFVYEASGLTEEKKQTEAYVEKLNKRLNKTTSNKKGDTEDH